MSIKSLVKEELKSRAARKLVGEDGDGVRTIDMRKSVEIESEDDDRNLLEFLWDAASGAVGWLWNIGSGIVNGFSGLMSLPETIGGWWQALSQGAVALLFYDWNQTDAQIDQQIQGHMNAAAEAAGEAVGFTVCGAANVGAALLIPKVGPVLAKLAAKDLAEEAWDEFKSATRILLQGMVQSGILLLYKNVRAWIKQIAPFLPEPLKNFLDSWGDGKKPWIIYSALEEQIEKIPNELIKNFAQGALEGCIEGWVEASAIVGNNIEAALAAIAAANGGADGETVSVEVDFSEVEGDEDSDPLEGKLLVQAKENELEETVANVMATKQIIGNQTVGLLVGQPAEDYVTSMVMLRRLELLFYRGVDKPPWRHNNRPANQTTVTIPNPKKGLTWTIIKRACRQWTWGKFRAELLLDSGRKIVVYGSTSDVASKKAEEFAVLSLDEKVAINVIEEKLRHEQIRKTPIQAYPARGTLLVRRPSNTLTGRTDIQGNRWEDVPQPFELWTDAKPSNMPTLL